MTPLSIVRRTGRRLASGLSLAALLLLVVACGRARCGSGLEAVTIAGHTFCLELSADVASRAVVVTNTRRYMSPEFSPAGTVTGNLLGCDGNVKLCM